MGYREAYYPSNAHRVLSLVSIFLSILVTITLFQLLLNWSSAGYSTYDDVYFSEYPKPKHQYGEVWQSWRQIISISKSQNSHQFVSDFRGDEFPHYWPIVIGKALLQVEDSVHFAVNNRESEREWLAIEMSGKGPVRFDEEKHVVLPSFFHQIHCLQTFRDELANRSSQNLAHLQHCANYLRQSALCRTDLTLEPGDFAQRDFEFDRKGAVHLCRDWSRVYNEAENNWGEWVAFWLDNNLSRFVNLFVLTCLDFTDLIPSKVPWPKFL